MVRNKGEGGIYQRVGDGRWVGVVEGGYVPGPDGKSRRVRRTVTAKTKRQLLPKFERLKKEVAAGVTGESLTVEQWVNVWHKRGRGPSGDPLAPRTLAVYRGYLDQYVIPTLGRHRLSSLRAHDVQGMLDWMEEQGKSGATRRQAYSVVRRALEVAAKEQRVLENVAARIDRPRADGEAHKALTVAQAHKVITGAPTSLDLVRWLLALHVGMRQGEVLGLRWEDVRLDEPVPWLAVQQQVQRLPGEGLVVRGTTKSHKPRVIVLTGALEHVVVAMRTLRTELGGVGYVIGGEQAVAPRRDWGLWRETLAAAGLPNTPLHGARGTAREYLDQQGVPHRTISDILGHAETQITDTVYHSVTIEGLVTQMSKSKALPRA